MMRRRGWNSFEARMYDPVVGRWISVDPARQFASSYVGMGNDPINGIDPDGCKKSPIFNKDGSKFLGVDSEGYKGDVILMDEDDFNDLTDNGKNVLDHSIAELMAANRINGASFLGSADISLENRSFIYTHVLKQMSKLDFSELYGGRVSIFKGTTRNNIPQGYNDPNTVGRFNGDPLTKKISVHIYHKNDLISVEAIQNLLGVHEWYGHIVKKLAYGGDKSEQQKIAEHQLVYKIQTVHPTFKGLEKDLQQEIILRSKSHPSKW